MVTTQSVKIGEAGMFLKANSALVGPAEGIALRFPERRNDHEAELVMVIGKPGSDIPRARALDHVAGYCLGLDMTVRGREDRSFRKSIDSYAVLGPWMVTADEIADPDALPLSLTVNGETRQNSNTDMLIYDCRRLIEFALVFLHALSRRSDLYRDAGGRRSGQARRYRYLSLEPGMGERKSRCARMTQAAHIKYSRKRAPPPERGRSATESRRVGVTTTSDSDDPSPTRLARRPSPFRGGREVKQE